MANGDKPPINGAQGWGIFAGSMMAALLGSGGGVYAYMKNAAPQQMQAIARPDPAYGSEMRLLERDMQIHLQNHPDRTNQFDRRITILETQIQIIIGNQKQIMATQRDILKRLDSLK